MVLCRLLLIISNRCTPSDDPFDVKSSLPNDLMREYYEQRASAGLLITEATAVSEAGSGWRNAPLITTEEHAQAWKPIVDAVHARGSVIYLQLWHMGRQCHSSHHPSTPGKIFAPSAIAMSGAKVKTVYAQDAEPEVPSAMTTEEIDQTVQDFVRGAKLAKLAGFDGVEVHGANGYLIDTFLQSSTNKRTDKYGGSIENRARLLTEIVEAIAESGSYPYERIGWRMSPNGAFGSMGSEDNYESFVAFAKLMNKYSPAYCHVMDGLGFGYHDKCKAVTCADIRKVFDGPILTNVGLTKEMAEGMIRSGVADGAVFGRLYISNPDLVERFANDWPLEEPGRYEHWWGWTAEKGYTDFPAYAAPAE
jgi:N-ethylmaleimide reductase